MEPTELGPELGPDLGIAGKLALVSGREAMDAAQALAAAGVRVVLTDPSAQWLGRAAARLNGCAGTIVADLSRHADVARVAKATDAMGGCDILVHAVPAETRGAERWEDDFMSALRLSRPMVPQMLRAAWGRVIFLMASGHGSEAETSLSTFAKGVAMSYSPRGVAFRMADCGTVVPALCAMTDSQIGEKSGDSLEQNRRRGVVHPSVTNGA